MSRALMAASTKPLILYILEKGESYGYEIIQTLNAFSGGEIEWPEGTLYPVLQRLEKDNLVSSQWKISEKNRPRKYYAITEKGLEELQKEMIQLNSFYKIFSKLLKDSDLPDKKMELDHV